jgi:hypothetical protein
MHVAARSCVPSHVLSISDDLAPQQGHPILSKEDRNLAASIEADNAKIQGAKYGFTASRADMDKVDAKLSMANVDAKLSMASKKAKASTKAKATAEPFFTRTESIMHFIEK